MTRLISPSGNAPYNATDAPLVLPVPCPMPDAHGPGPLPVPPGGCPRVGGPATSGRPSPTGRYVERRPLDWLRCHWPCLSASQSELFGAMQRFSVASRLPCSASRGAQRGWPPEGMSARCLAHPFRCRRVLLWPDGQGPLWSTASHTKGACYSEVIDDGQRRRGRRDGSNRSRSPVLRGKGGFHGTPKSGPAHR